MSSDKSIKITKKDGSFSIVPAGQRSIYESFNAKARKLKKEKDVVTIEDYEEPKPAAEAKTAGLSGSTGTGESAKKTALEVIDLIGKATTAEEVAALADGDGRVSVIKAAEAKTAELAGN